MGWFNFGKGKTLYYPGCAAKFLVKDIQRRHEQILTLLEIEYIKLPELEVCCGRPALDFGFVDDFKSLRLKNMEAFENQKVKKIISSDPKCYSTINKKYEDVEVVHISRVILENLDKIDKNFDGQEPVTFYDSSNPEKLTELYENPRKILKELGMNLVELEFNKEKSLCCGEELRPISPKVADRMAEEVLKQVKTRTLITMSPNSYIHLKKNNKYGIKILELSEVLV